MQTLDAVFDPRRNSLNALRLVLATLVIVSHSWPIGGYGQDPGMGDLSLGEWAVAGFFAVSGYLITLSRVRSRSLMDYLWRRVLRIYPAFLVVLLVVAFVFAPIGAAIGNGAWEPLVSVTYVLRNLGLRITQMGIPGTLDQAPYPDVWNGSLWTLWYEFLCYVVLGLLLTALPSRFVPRAAVAASILLPLAVVLVTVLGTPSLALLNAVTLGGYFAAGSMLYCYRDRVPSHPALAVLAATVIVVTAATGTFRVFAGVPVAYLMMWLGVVLPLSKVGAVNDISYGMYVYAFPVQQMLALLLVGMAVPAPVFVLLAIILTVPFAAASWFLVERPAMRWKSHRWWRRRRAAPPPVGGGTD